MSKRKQILPRMFDVKPTKSDGSLDLEKIQGVRKIVKIEKPSVRIQKQKSRNPKNSIAKNSRDVLFAWAKQSAQPPPPATSGEPQFFARPNVVQMGKIFPADYVSVSKIITAQEQPRVFLQQPPEHEAARSCEPAQIFSEIPAEIISPERVGAGYDLSEASRPITEDIFGLSSAAPFRKSSRRKKRRFRRRRSLSKAFSAMLQKENFALSANFAAALILFALIIPAFSFFENGLERKIVIEDFGKKAFAGFSQAKENLAAGDFENAAENFTESYASLSEANDNINSMGGKFSELLRFIPVASSIATADYLVSAGKDIASAGKKMSDSLKVISGIENPIDADTGPSLANVFLQLRDATNDANSNLLSAQENIAKVDTADVPAEIRPELLKLKEKLPVVTRSLTSFAENSNIILDVLGYNGPRKFLFLFQNNQEMRATGGFIGSYGVLNVADGRVKNIFVDDIYNPDGQLKARVVPPEPIQKMSAVWTMHDANWFPDFPTSAEKISWFYEKTGGPTVDGVVAMTPTLIQKFLAVTGPIEMPEYDTVVDEHNFVEKTQFEVEEDFDKEENKPKKFIADLTPKILDKILDTRDARKMLSVVAILDEALKEKHLLIYSKNFNVQQMISAQGWSGEVLNSSKDYLSVINSNINGFKTDGVIEETIEHSANIAEDGSVTDEVTVRRKHNGGNKEFDWWNKVNADYIRVYVPEGSEFLEASGQTREFIAPPIDYGMLEFKKDPQLLQADGSATIDEESGTKIYRENHKTVFANWAYVSPGETVELKYKYRLPFSVHFDSLHHPADSFSILYQKQSGSLGSRLKSKILFPQNYAVTWKFPDALQSADQNAYYFESDLSSDKFIGMTFEQK